MSPKNRVRLTELLQTVERQLQADRPASADLTFASGKYTLRVANDLVSRERAYRLVYDLYRERGYANSHRSGMWITPYDLTSQATTILAEREDGKPVGALTVVIDSKMGLPAEEVYGPEVAQLRSSGRKMAEVISLAVCEDERNSSLVLLKLFNFAYFVARGLHGATDFLVTVSPKHARLYSRLLLFSQIGGERQFGKINGTTGVLIRLDFDVAEQERRYAGTELAAKSAYSKFKAVFEAIDTVEYLREQVCPMTEEEISFFTSCRELGSAAKTDRLNRFRMSLLKSRSEDPFSQQLRRANA